MSNENMYIIRYSLPPEEPKGKRIDLLLEFCEQGKIDEVMFFLMPEEYNTGQWREIDYRPWLDFAAEAKEIVERAGYSTSINPWHTMLHLDRGRKSEDLQYRRMVLDTGYRCSAVACPLCPDWQEIFYRTFRDFALAGFRSIWIEDDWRFHNHNSEYGWGGCFCDEHIEVLRQRGARAKSREELIANLNAEGQVHPDRLIWLELNRETHINLASRMRETMDSVAPKIKLGLMASSICTHTQEGRDWDKLIEAMGGPELAEVRPHATGYREGVQIDFFNGYGNLSQTLNSIVPGTKTFFEIENSPMSRFSKSNHQTRMQMASAVEGGCDGLTLDVLDFLGAGGSSEPKMAETLAGSKDKLLSLRDMIKDTSPIGVQAILPNNTTDLAPGTGICDLRKLPTINYGWFIYLQGYGYPCIDTPEIASVDSSQIYGLSGNSVWGLSDDLLRELLAGGTVLLDAEAAAIIHKRGMGGLIGIKGITRYYREDYPYSFEEHVGRDKDEIPERASVNKPVQDIFVCVYELSEGASVRTEMKDCFLRTMGPASVTYQNSSGGKGLVLPFALPAPVVFYGWERKRWIDRWLAELTGSCPLPNVADEAWVHLAARIGADYKTIFLANETFEFIEQMQVNLPAGWEKLDWQIKIHNRDKAGKTEIHGQSLKITAEMAGNDWIMLVGM